MPLFTRFYTSQVVQEFFHEPYHPLQFLTPPIETPGHLTYTNNPLLCGLKTDGFGHPMTSQGFFGQIEVVLLLFPHSR